MYRLFCTISLTILLISIPTSTKSQTSEVGSAAEILSNDKQGGVRLSFEEGTTGSLDLSEYAKIVQERVLKHWRLPEAYEVAHAKRKEWVAVCFSVSKDGSISDIQVSQSSNDKEYDNLACEAIRLSSPLPPLPSEVKLPKIRATFRFYLNMEVP